MIDQFWSARPVLQHVLQVARARGAGPWAVLGAAMARAVMITPHEIVLPGIVGGRVSLNLFIAHVGASGGGKGIAETVANDGFDYGGIEIETIPLGTGEGINRTFRPIGTESDAPNPVSAAYFTAAEIDTYAAIAGRTGSTLSAELRKMFTGEQLGFGNAGKDTRVIVPAGSYRACLSIGVQPRRSQALLGAADGGLPQRFVWLPTSDPDVPDDLPADPGVWKITRPSWLRAIGSTVELTVPEIAVDTIRSHRRAVLREDPDVDPLDGHSLLTRLKVSAALMALDGRTIVDEYDWKLAGHVMEISAHTRERCRKALIELSRGQNTARALAAADRDEITSDRKAQRARHAVVRMLNRDGELTRGALLRRIKADIRDYLDSAVHDLAATGSVVVSPGKTPDTWDTVSLGTQGTNTDLPAQTPECPSVPTGHSVPTCATCRSPLGSTGKCVTCIARKYNQGDKTA